MEEEDIIKKIKSHDLMFIEKVSIDHEFSDNTFLIHKAALYGHLDLMLYIIGKRGIEVLNKPGGKYGSTALFFTIYNHVYEATYFVSQVFSLEKMVVMEKNRKGIPILHVCVKFDNIIAFIILFNSGFSLEVLDNKGRDVYEYAKEKKKNRFILLLDKLFLNEYQHNYCKNKNIKDKIDTLSNFRKKILKRKNSVNNFTYNICIVLFGITINIMGIYKYPKIFYILAPFSMIKNRPLLENHLFVFINLLYTLNYIINLLFNFNNLYVWITIILYLSIILKLGFNFSTRNPEPQMCSQSSMKILYSLIQKNELSMNTFCYLCWTEKKYGTVHCHICKICVNEHDHHCKFLGICISKKNIFLFDLYLYSTFFLFLFLPKIEFISDCKTIYSIFAFFVVLQVLTRISVTFENKKLEIA